MGRDLSDLSFPPAPAGGRVRLATGFVLVLAVVITVIDLVVLFSLEEGAQPWPLLLGPVVVWVVFSVIGFGARIRAYRFRGDTLVVDRALLKPEFSLAGLESVTADREALAGAIRTFGNGGLGAICGRFRSRRLGPFRAYVTNGENAVILRWPDRRVVVSPDRIYPFLETVRQHAGLRS